MKTINVKFQSTQVIYDEVIRPAQTRRQMGPIVTTLIEGYASDPYIRRYVDSYLDGSDVLRVSPSSPDEVLQELTLAETALVDIERSSNAIQSLVEAGQGYFSSARTSEDRLETIELLLRKLLSSAELSLGSPEGDIAWDLHLGASAAAQGTPSSQASAAPSAEGTPSSQGTPSSDPADTSSQGTLSEPLTESSAQGTPSSAEGTPSSQASAAPSAEGLIEVSDAPVAPAESSSDSSDTSDFDQLLNSIL